MKEYFNKFNFHCTIHGQEIFTFIYFPVVFKSSVAI